jgi:hypothetical protein
MSKEVGELAKACCGDTRRKTKREKRFMGPPLKKDFSALYQSILK